ncbi:MAG TPA: hypothetical protein PLV52_06485, partial [Candidatus Omnitrophota bacterium]|nr:hypothetical protein [Candidatus Omnitrophota bacterium]
ADTPTLVRDETFTDTPKAINEVVGMRYALFRSGNDFVDTGEIVGYTLASPWKYAASPTEKTSTRITAAYRRSDISGITTNDEGRRIATITDWASPVELFAVHQNRRQYFKQYNDPRTGAEGLVREERLKTVAEQVGELVGRSYWLKRDENNPDIFVDTGIVRGYSAGYGASYNNIRMIASYDSRDIKDIVNGFVVPQDGLADSISPVDILCTLYEGRTMYFKPVYDPRTDLEGLVREERIDTMADSKDEIIGESFELVPGEGDNWVDTGRLIGRTVGTGYTYKGARISASYLAEQFEEVSGDKKFARPRAGANPAEMFTLYKGVSNYFNFATVKGKNVMVRDARISLTAHELHEIIGMRFGLALDPAANNFTDSGEVLGYMVGSGNTFNGVRISESYDASDVTLAEEKDRNTILLYNALGLKVPPIAIPNGNGDPIELMTVYRGNSVYFKPWTDPATMERSLVLDERAAVIAKDAGDIIGVRSRLNRIGNAYTKLSFDDPNR